MYNFSVKFILKTTNRLINSFSSSFSCIFIIGITPFFLGKILDQLIVQYGIKDIILDNPSLISKIKSPFQNCVWQFCPPSIVFCRNDVWKVFYKKIPRLVLIGDTTCMLEGFKFLIGRLQTKNLLLLNYKSKWCMWGPLQVFLSVGIDPARIVTIMGN